MKRDTRPLVGATTNLTLETSGPKEPQNSEQNDELLQSMIVGAARAYRHFQDARGTFVDGVSDEDFGDDYQDDDY